MKSYSKSETAEKEFKKEKFKPIAISMSILEER
jgi:hypothetical protein